MLYFTSITIFSSFMVWELRRQKDKKGDCCGACKCSEDTIFCCKGKFLTATQKSYPFQGEETDPVPEEKYATTTQKILHLYFSKVSLSKPGIGFILILWLVLTIVFLLGVLELKIDFKTTYFISGGAYFKNYLETRD